MDIISIIMIYYGLRKATAKQKGTKEPYLFVMLPTKYTRTFNVQKRDSFSIYATKKGNLILMRDKNDY
jgi:hypothetical protein